MQDINEVRVSKAALKDIRKVPSYIVEKLQSWVENVGNHGLSEIRKIPGYHDEPLKGKRRGQRSIRLSKAYRAIYTVERDGSVTFLEICEVNKHEY